MCSNCICIFTVAAARCLLSLPAVCAHIELWYLFIRHFSLFAAFLVIIIAKRVQFLSAARMCVHLCVCSCECECTPAYVCVRAFICIQNPYDRSYPLGNACDASSTLCTCFQIVCRRLCYYFIIISCYFYHGSSHPFVESSHSRTHTQHTRALSQVSTYNVSRIKRLCIGYRCACVCLSIQK